MRSPAILNKQIAPVDERMTMDGGNGSTTGFKQIQPPVNQNYGAEFRERIAGYFLIEERYTTISLQTTMKGVVKKEETLMGQIRMDSKKRYDCASLICDYFLKKNIRHAEVTARRYRKVPSPDG